MFGELALSERAIAAQGTLFFGTETLDANFTQTSAGNGIFTDASYMIGTSSKVRVRFGEMTVRRAMSSSSQGW